MSSQAPTSKGCIVSPISDEEICTDSIGMAAKLGVRRQTVYSAELAVSAGEIVLAIVDVTDVDGAISTIGWRIVQNRLSELAREILGKRTPVAPLFRDGGLYDGCIQLVICPNAAGAELLRQAVDKLGEVLIDSHMAVLRRDQLICGPRATATIPSDPADATSALRIIRSSNPEMPTANWRLYSFRPKTGDTRDITLVLNHESVPHLIKAEWVIKFGTKSIPLTTFLNFEGENATPLGWQADGPMRPATAMNDIGRIETPEAFYYGGYEGLISPFAAFRDIPKENSSKDD